MSVDNGKISPRMGTKLAIDHTNGDLQKVFGTTQHDNQAWYFSDADINIFAKFKPFVPASGNGIYADHFTAADGTPNTSGDRYTAALAAYFGLTPPTKRATANLIVSNNDKWTYTRPVQGQNPLRAMDFEAYNHYAPPPCEKLGDPSTGEIKVAIASTTTFSFGAYIQHPPSGGDSITWQDLPNLDTNEGIGAYYLCVVFAKSEDFSGDMIAKTSSVSLSSGGIVLDLTNLELRNLLSYNYKYYLLCARKNKILNGTSMTAPGSDTYVALPTKNGISDVKGKFTLVLSNLGNMVIQSVNSTQSPTSSDNFTLVTGSGYDYHGTSYSDTDAYYYKVGNTNYINFGMKITASDQSFTLNATQISVSRTFFSDTPIPVQNATLYTANAQHTLVQQSSVTVAAGSNATVFIVAAAPLMALDADGRSNTGTGDNAYFTMRVSLYQNNALLASDDIRVRNYNNIP